MVADWIITAAFTGLAVGFVVGHQVCKWEYGVNKRPPPTPPTAEELLEYLRRRP